MAYPACRMWNKSSWIKSTRRGGSWGRWAGRNSQNSAKVLIVASDGLWDVCSEDFPKLHFFGFSFGIFFVWILLRCILRLYVPRHQEKAVHIALDARASLSICIVTWMSPLCRSLRSWFLPIMHTVPRIGLTKSRFGLEYEAWHWHTLEMTMSLWDYLCMLWTLYSNSCLFIHHGCHSRQQIEGCRARPWSIPGQMNTWKAWREQNRCFNEGLHLARCWLIMPWLKTDSWIEKLTTLRCL